MASNVIDLISSSPPRNAAPPRRPTQPPPSPPDRAAAAPTAHIEIHSDDFCSSDDDVFANTRPVNEPDAKKPRLSAEGSGSRRLQPPATSTSTQSFQVNGSESAILPDIECISSFEAHVVALSSPKPRTTSLKRSRTEPLLPSSLIPDSDPFASSPPKPSAQPTKGQATQDLLSDPFASSPHKSGTKPVPAQLVQNLLSDPFASSPRKAVTKSIPAQLSQDLLSDPFASSPPVRASSSRLDTNPRDAPRPKATAAAWDPISSSAPCSSAPPNITAASNRRSRSPSVISIGDSSASSDDEFPSLANFDLSQGRSSHLYSATAAKSKTANKTKRNPQSRPRQAIDPSQRAATKALEKEQKRQAREREKADRQRERDVAAAIVEVNKAKGNRKVSTKEMIVDIPLSLPSTIKVQLETLLDGLEVQHHEHACPLNAVKWRRKVNSKFDDESGQWVPMPLRIEKDEHILVFMTAEDMVQLAVDDGLDAHMATLRRQYPDEKLVYILQGVTTWMRKNRNVRNRHFAAGVRSQNEAPPASSRRRAEPAEYIDEDTVEDAILRLQVDHDVLIHHTAIPLETAQWISVFTQNISTIPYKRQRDEDTAGARFCMDSGQVRTGDGTRDTYVRMLQEIFRVTAPIAYGVAGEFGSVSELVAGLEARGALALEGVRKSANKDGALSERAVGQAVSRRLYKIFTGRDETSTDV